MRCSSRSTRLEQGRGSVILKTRNIIVSIIHVVLVLILLVATFVALSTSVSASVNVWIADANAQTSCSTTTKITINNMTNFGAATVTLSYDPDVVQITDITAGDVGTPITNINNTTGTATIAAYITTATGPDSPITFANLELLAIGSSGETSPLILAVITFADADGVSVSATPINGAFVVDTGVKGDLNSDGTLTPADAAIALRLAASGGWDPAADTNHDSRITSLDALMILQAAADAIDL